MCGALWDGVPWPRQVWGEAGAGGDGCPWQGMVPISLPLWGCPWAGSGAAEGGVGSPGAPSHTRVHQLGEFLAQALFDSAHFTVHGEGLDV